MQKNTTVVATENATERKSFGKFISKKLSKMTIAFNTALMMAMFSAINASAENGGTTGGSLDTTQGVDQFNQIIQFFAEWIGRIGLVIGFVGGIMFALAIKNDDPDQKQRGLMTLASGFVVFALTKALDLFGITSGGTTAALMLF